MNNEPVAWIKQNPETLEAELHFDKPAKYWATVVSNPDIPLYTHPVKELTLSPDEIFDIWDEHTDYDGNFVTSVDDFVFSILRKAQKNG